IALADDGRLPRLEVDGAALQRQRFGYPRPGTEEHFYEHPETEPIHIVRTRPVADRNCCDILLNLIGREELHFPFRNARQADLLYVHSFKSHGELAEAQERFQRSENMRNPARSMIAPSALGFDQKDMLLGNASRRDLAEPANDPAHRVLILFERSRRPAKFHLAVAEKIRHEFADRGLSLGFCRTGKHQGCRGEWNDRAGRAIRKHKTATPKESDRCMLVVALNRTELRSRNESGFGVPRPTLTADSLLQRHSFVRFGGSTPSNPHGSIPVTVTSVPTLEI